MLAANLIAMLMLKRLNVQLDRDVIFLAESGEEADPTGVGINFMVREHFDEIDAEFALTEGGGATLDGGRVTIVEIGTAEKLPARVRLVATGTAGHGSVPRADNALIHLAAAVEKVGRWETPMRLNETTRAYFENLGKISHGRARRDLPGVARSTNCRRRSELPARTLAVRIFDAAHIGGSHDAEGWRGGKRHPVGSRSDAGHPCAARRERAGVLCGNGQGDRRPGGEDRPAPANPAAVPGITPRHRDVSRPGTRGQTGPIPRRRSCRRCPPAPAIRRNCARRASSPTASVRPSTESDEMNYPAHGDVERLAESSLYPFVEYVWTVVGEMAAHRLGIASANRGRALIANPSLVADEGRGRFCCTLFGWTTSTVSKPPSVPGGPTSHRSRRSRPNLRRISCVTPGSSRGSACSMWHAGPASSRSRRRAAARR